tara:strand:- start:11768 stop:12787 length:1020 start_codon:yes stop_codon:yes gene_type:complete
MVQYFPHLIENGFKLDFRPLLVDNYLIKKYNKNIAFGLIINAYIKRILKLISLNKYDLIWLEKELFPFLPAWVEKLLSLFDIPIVVDIDDAIFHQYDQHSNKVVKLLYKSKIDKIMKNANLVIAGNDYLAERATSAGAKNVIIVPTVIDLDRYPLLNKKNKEKKISVGWIGSPMTSHYLNEISSVIIELSNKKLFNFFAIGAGRNDFQDLPITKIPWSEDTEYNEITKFDIGIMPIPDLPWERGKCGYKLIQFMACKIPVIASPVGVNIKIVKNYKTGLLASSQSEWNDALLSLYHDSKFRTFLGQNGRMTVEKKYSLQVYAPKIVTIMKNLLMDRRIS